MCSKCKDEVASQVGKCERCGKTVTHEFINPNFDRTKFDSLMNGTNTEKEDFDEDVDVDLIHRLRKGDSIGGENTI